jgi:hypothetical protein
LLTECRCALNDNTHRTALAACSAASTTYPKSFSIQYTQAADHCLKFSRFLHGGQPNSLASQPLPVSATISRCRTELTAKRKARPSATSIQHLASKRQKHQPDASAAVSTIRSVVMQNVDSHFFYFLIRQRKKENVEGVRQRSPKSDFFHTVPAII